MAVEYLIQQFNYINQEKRSKYYVNDFFLLHISTIILLLLITAFYIWDFIENRKLHISQRHTK